MLLPRQNLQQSLVLVKCEALCFHRRGREPLGELGSLLLLGFVYKQSGKNSPICNVKTDLSQFVRSLDVAYG